MSKIRAVKSYSIVRVCESDLDACAEVIRQGFATVAEQFGLTRENCPTNGAFIDSSRLAADFAREVFLFALYENGEMAGFVSLEDMGSGVFEMERLAVIPARRHLGYGKALIDFAKDTALSFGGHKITIGMIDENTLLKKWYLGNGFVQTGIRFYQHLPFTVGFMELIIIAR